MLLMLLREENEPEPRAQYVEASKGVAAYQRRELCQLAVAVVAQRAQQRRHLPQRHDSECILRDVERKCCAPSHAL